MAEHECRYVGFTGGPRRCPVCLSEEPQATEAGDDHGDQQEVQRDEAHNDEGGGHEIDPAQFESTDEPSSDVVVDEEQRDEEPAEEPSPRRRGLRSRG